MLYIIGTPPAPVKVVSTNVTASATAFQSVVANYCNTMHLIYLFFSKCYPDTVSSTYMIINSITFITVLICSGKQNQLHGHTPLSE